MVSAATLVAPPVNAAVSIDLSIQEANGNVTAVTLECDPPGGDHPHAWRACKSLHETNGDFGKLPHEQIMCPDTYAPVTVSAKGHWYNRPVNFSHEYPNQCHANAATASVFDFRS